MMTDIEHERIVATQKAFIKGTLQALSEAASDGIITPAQQMTMMQLTVTSSSPQINLPASPSAVAFPKKSTKRKRDELLREGRVYGVTIAATMSSLGPTSTSTTPIIPSLPTTTITDEERSNVAVVTPYSVIPPITPVRILQQVQPNILHGYGIQSVQFNNTVTRTKKTIHAEVHKNLKVGGGKKACKYCSKLLGNAGICTIHENTCPKQYEQMFKLKNGSMFKHVATTLASQVSITSIQSINGDSTSSHEQAASSTASSGSDEVNSRLLVDLVDSDKEGEEDRTKAKTGRRDRRSKFVDARQYNKGANQRHSYTYRQKAHAMMLSADIGTKNAANQLHMPESTLKGFMNIDYSLAPEKNPINIWLDKEVSAADKNRKRARARGAKQSDRGRFYEAERRLILEIVAMRKRGRRVAPKWVSKRMMQLVRLVYIKPFLSLNPLVGEVENVSVAVDVNLVHKNIEGETEVFAAADSSVAPPPPVIVLAPSAAPIITASSGPSVVSVTTAADVTIVVPSAPTVASDQSTSSVMVPSGQSMASVTTATDITIMVPAATAATSSDQSPLSSVLVVTAPSNPCVAPIAVAAVVRMNLNKARVVMSHAEKAVKEAEKAALKVQEKE